MHSSEPHSVEEKLNSITHGIGTGLSIAGLVILITLTAQRSGRPLAYVSYSIYGAFQIVLYLASTLTHQFSDMPGPGKVFRIMDQASVYLLIAGTYTPAVLLGLGGAWGWSLFGVIWALALAGIVMKTIFLRVKHIGSDLLYLPMGWLIIVAARPMADVMPHGFIRWMFIGGGCYTVGIIFYLAKRIPFAHLIWHLFVLGGGISFFMGFVLYLC